jgi:hypothetical protein
MFVLGLPVFVVLAIVAVRSTWWGWRVRTRPLTFTEIVAGACLLYAGLFAMFLTGLGPFVNQTEVRTYDMHWTIGRQADGDVVTLTFVEFPNHFISRRSPTLIHHLQQQGDNPVPVEFRITRDYGSMRGYSEQRIAGLDVNTLPDRGFGSGGRTGSDGPSPWD